MQGLILIDKPGGITSFGAVARIKRAAHEKRVGHTGTLDPMATGVLPVLLGRATALSSLLLDADKRYTAEIRLGTVTDTDDITGNVLSENAVNVTKEELEDALLHFTGKIKQRPPAYSALKKDGVPMYRLARRGDMPEIPEREVEIFEISQPTGLTGDTFKIDVHVSKGTYIRSLARDIGEFLGCGACLSALRRTYAGGFNISECTALDNITEENISQHIVSEEKAVAYLREVNVTEKQAVRFCNGGKLAFDRLQLTDAAENELFRVKCGELFLGIGAAENEKEQLAIKCIINYPEEMKR